MFPHLCRWRQTNHECVHPSWLADAANVGLHPSCNVERVSSTNNGQVKWFRDNHTAHCQTHEIPWAPTQSSIQTQQSLTMLNNHAMNTTCMCNPKHSSKCIQVSGNAIGRHPATTQTQITHKISETAHNRRPRKRCRKRTGTANAGTFRTLHICVPSSGTAKIN